uniref:Uncharacterized protein n=1 Tax=Arundo donax TaxID=35708 RepID=A0A0A9F8N5_ARUDO
MYVFNDQSHILVILRAILLSRWNMVATVCVVHFRIKLCRR